MKLGCEFHNSLGIVWFTHQLNVQIIVTLAKWESIYPQLKEEPHYGNNIKKLVGYKPEIWRYRIGKFRLFYVIDENEKIIYILSIDLRKDAY